MKTEGTKCISIKEIEGYLETEVATKFPQIHTVTGYDTTSSLHVVGKIQVLKKYLNGNNSGFKTRLLFHDKLQKQQFKILKSLTKLFAALDKKKRV